MTTSAVARPTMEKYLCEIFQSCSFTIWVMELYELFCATGILIEWWTHRQRDKRNKSNEYHTRTNQHHRGVYHLVDQNLSPKKALAQKYSLLTSQTFKYSTCKAECIIIAGFIVLSIDICYEVYIPSERRIVSDNPYVRVFVLPVNKSFKSRGVIAH